MPGKYQIFINFLGLLFLFLYQTGESSHLPLHPQLEDELNLLLFNPPPSINLFFCPEPVWLPGPQFQHGGHVGLPAQGGVCPCGVWKLPPYTGTRLRRADQRWVRPCQPGRPSLQWHAEEAGLPTVGHARGRLSSVCRTR